MIFVVNQFLLVVEVLLLSLKRKDSNRKIFLVVSFFQLFVLLAFRSFQVGVDTPNYLMYFNIVDYGGHVTAIEPLNLFIMKIASFFRNGEVVYLSIYAFLTLICYYRYIVKNSADVYMSVFIFSGLMFYYFSFNAMRQGLAIAICLVAISKLLDGKQLAFLVLVLMAAGIHFSALIVLPVWIIKKFDFKFSVKITFFVIGANVCSMLFGARIVNFFVRFFPQYSGYINSTFGEEGNILNPLMYIVILTIIVYIWVHNKKEENDSFWLYMLCIGVVLYFLSMQVGIVNRIVYYYTTSVIVLLPNVLQRIAKVKNRVPLVAGLYGTVFIYSFLLIQRSAHGIVPYTFFWQV